MAEEKRKAIQLSILARVTGNNNANETVGNVIKLKTIWTGRHTIIPFISARAVKRGVREALRRMGYKINTLMLKEEGGKIPLDKVGRPDIYIDEDLFGYMIASKTARYHRHGPVGISYFKSLEEVELSHDFAGRFPWDGAKEDPQIFTVEVTEFTGRINTVIYDYIGDFTRETENEKIKKRCLPIEERFRRLHDFLEVFIKARYELPRRANSHMIPEYLGCLVATTESALIPIGGYHRYNSARDAVDFEALRRLVEAFDDVEDVKLYYITYVDDYSDELQSIGIDILKLKEAPKKLAEFMFPQE